jgi:hypothetical protein
LNCISSTSTFQTLVSHHPTPSTFTMATKAEGKEVCLETGRHLSRRERKGFAPSMPKEKERSKSHWEWFWFCCQCQGGPVAADGYNNTCQDWNCGHTRCSGCKLEQHKVRDKA